MATSLMFSFSRAVIVPLQKRIFKWLIKLNQSEPRRIVSDKLESYDVAHRERMPDVMHDTNQYANNRAELSYQLT
jgi:transposase-like protein